MKFQICLQLFYYQICLHFKQVSKGGVQVKASKGRGRPSGETPRAVIEYINSIAPPALHDDPQPQFIPSSTTKKLTCPVCMDVVHRPVELSCDHIICCTCCCTAIQSEYECIKLRKRHPHLPEILPEEFSDSLHSSENAHHGGSHCALAQKVADWLWIDGGAGSRVYSCPHELTRPYSQTHT